MTDEYRLLDHGAGRRLEDVGGHRVIRPAPQALWAPTLPKREWDRAVGVYRRSSSGGGEWTWTSGVPPQWTVRVDSRAFVCRPTGFGHLGLFGEQAPLWTWIEKRVREAGGEVFNMLNLFAYTGGSTLAACEAGARATHIDASRGVVGWARENAALRGLADAPVRYIAEDARKFVAREARRGARCEGIVLDPPSFGRGPKGEVWKIDEHLPDLLTACRALLSENRSFLLLTAHTPGYTPLTARNLVARALDGLGGVIESGELAIPAESGLLLPSGVFARWSAER